MNFQKSLKELKESMILDEIGSLERPVFFEGFKIRNYKKSDDALLLLSKVGKNSGLISTINNSVVETPKRKYLVIEDKTDKNVLPEYDFENLSRELLLAANKKRTEIDNIKHLLSFQNNPYKTFFTEDAKRQMVINSLFNVGGLNTSDYASIDYLYKLNKKNKVEDIISYNFLNSYNNYEYSKKPIHFIYNPVKFESPFSKTPLSFFEYLNNLKSNENFRELFSDYSNIVKKFYNIDVKKASHDIEKESGHQIEKGYTDFVQDTFSRLKNNL